MIPGSDDAIAAARKAALTAAIARHREGRLAEAEAAYRQVLAGAPRDPDALHYLGVLCHHRGENADAVDLIQRAIAGAPGYADAHNNLGNVLRALGRTEEAAAAYRRALALRPDDASIENNLGMTLRWLGQVDDAIALHRRAIARAPDRGVGYFGLGQALRASGDLEGAIAALYESVARAPDHISAYQSLARALQRAGRGAEAVGVFERWLARDPGNPVASHMLAACSGREVPPRASDAFVLAVFDTLARQFDEHLRELDYRAPELALEAVAACAGAPRAALDVADAGCGTGLCGALLRPYARRLIGVDLSAAMLARAGGRAVYDELVEAELTAYLRERPAAFDLIVSADTLVYFGDLRAVLAAAARALRPAGHVVFTVERADVEEEGARAGYRLEAHGRYAHTAGYLRGETAAAGLALVSMAASTLRLEGGHPVAGYVVTARKA